MEIISEFFRSITEIQWWLIIFLFFLIMEIFVPALVMLSLALGSLLGVIFSYLGLELWIQILVFSIVSILSLFLIRPIFMKKNKNVKDKSNVDAMIGKRAKVIEEINHIEGTGRVSYFGDRFPAVSIDNEIIKKNTQVVIEKLESITLIVKPLK